MNEFNDTFDNKSAAADLVWLIKKCDERCLFECSKWASEQLYYMPLGDEFEFTDLDNETNQTVSVRFALDFCRKLIQNGEYYRARFFMGKLKRETVVDHFLYYFSWYLISERLKAENNAAEDNKQIDDSVFMNLCKELERFYRKSPECFDSFMLYLMGLVQKEALQIAEAKRFLLLAIELEPRCWPAWDILISIISESDLNEMEARPLKNWYHELLVGETGIRFNLPNIAKGAFDNLKRMVFGESPYILCSNARIRSLSQENQAVIDCMCRVRSLDPYRIEDMNIYSDSLFVLEEELELGKLSSFFHCSHKFNWQTCYILANYYSRKKLHDKAVDFLKRAIRIQPNDARIWIVLGLELVNKRNHQSAILAYRKATSIDPASYKAWYGLGQLYEMLRLPSFALYYYQQAVRCHQSDSRMLVAAGVVLSKLKRSDDAEKCFKKAFQVGDTEGTALSELASLYQKMGRRDQAAKAFEHFLKLYCDEEKDVAYADPCMISNCYHFLAEYYFDNDDLDNANKCAQKCLQYDKTKEVGASILRALKIEHSTKRRKGDPNATKEDMARAFSTPVSGMGILKHSTPAVGRIAEGPRDLDLMLERQSPENVDEDMSMEDDEGDAEFAF